MVSTESDIVCHYCNSLGVTPRRFNADNIEANPSIKFGIHPNVENGDFP